MGRENPKRSAADLAEAPAQPEPNWREHNLWVQARAEADGIYDVASYQRIEDALPCEPSVDKWRLRSKFHEIGAAYIVDCRKKAEGADNSLEQNQLTDAVEGLDDALEKIGGLDPQWGDNRWIAKAARESSVPVHQIAFFLSSIKTLRDLLKSAAGCIPAPKSGPPERTVPALKLLLELWQEVTGRSALTRSSPSESSDATYEESFDEFKNFATAFIEPLRDAGFQVPDATYYQAQKLLKRR